MRRLTHIDGKGRARMVDVGAKTVTRRVAVAEGVLRAQPRTLRLMTAGSLRKGDAFTVAKVAGIQAAKRTAELIPLCHPLPLDRVDIEFKTEADRIRVRATCSVRARTGVEMEAMTAVAAACLTLYDMAKAAERGMEIGAIRLLRKTGGRSGTYVRAQD